MTDDNGNQTRYEYDTNQMSGIALYTMAKLINGQDLEQKQIRIPGKLIKGQTT